MVSLTIPMDERLYKQLHEIRWVNWSEVAREALLKREMFERYLKTGKLKEDDQKFCERIDWHPVDELPFKESYIKKIKVAERKHGARTFSGKKALDHLKSGL